MAARKQTTTAKAKQEAQAKAEATAPDVEQETQANAAASTAAEATEANAEPVAETPPQAPQPTEVQGNTVMGDGTGNALPPIEEAGIDAVMVRTKRRFKSRRRAGHRFNREGTGIALELLTKEQLKQLFNDPALDVMYCTIPVEGISEQES